MQPTNPETPMTPQPMAPMAPVYANAPTAAAEAPSDYISNPFLNSIRGLVQMLKVNPVSIMLSGLVGLLAIILFFIGQIVFTGVVDRSGSVGSVLIGGLIAVFILVIIFLLISGSYNVIAGRSVRNEVVTVGESYRVALKRIVGYTVLFIIYCILTMLLSLLVLLPGIYFATRASLAFFVFYEENLGPWASIKRSFSLTSGHFEEMFAAIIASSLLAGGSSGLLAGAISLAPLVGRYQDLKNLKDSGAAKPKVHYLNLVVTILTLLFITAYIVIVAVVSVKSTNSSSTTKSSFPSTSDFNSSTNTFSDPNSTFTN